MPSEKSNTSKHPSFRTGACFNGVFSYLYGTRRVQVPEEINLSRTARFFTFTDRVTFPVKKCPQSIEEMEWGKCASRITVSQKDTAVGKNGNIVVVSKANNRRDRIIALPYTYLELQSTVGTDFPVYYCILVL